MSNVRSVKGYLNEIERYYKSMKSAIDFDHYAYHLSFLKQQVEFLSHWKNIKEQLGLTEENLKHNPMYEVIGRFENVPPHFRPEYTHGDNSNG